MAFSRIQGKKLSILHSSRIDGQVKQIKLHTFDALNDAREVVDSGIKWDLFCETLNIQFAVKINKKKLRENIINRLKEVEFDEIDPTNKAVSQVLDFLQNCRPPLSPQQMTILKEAKNNLLELKEIIDKKLKILEAPMKSYLKFEETTAKKNLEQGLVYYRQGKWDEAKQQFLAGLKKEPHHVDLLVHAGLIEFIHGNYDPALYYFMNAKEMGTQFADLMIATDPDKYVKKVDLDKWAENRLCDLAGECPDYFTLKCDGCEDSPKNKKTELYRYMEFRPFFRSLTNTALTLMKLKKFEQAIQTITFCQEYQPLWGTFNMMGICYLSLGNVREADHWYNEFLWDDVYYIKALIKYLLGETEEAFRYLIPGIIKNQYIAKMLVGVEKREVIRYIGDALPDRLRASEFVYEHDYLFKQNPDFRNLIRCVLEYDEISALLDQLENEIDRLTADPKYVMDKHMWDLLHTQIEDDFIQDYIPKLIERLNDPAGPYWKPKANDVLDLKIIEKKSQNWIVALKKSEKQFYFRPKSHFGNNNNGDCIRICVGKAWFYRKGLYVSGEIEP